MNSSRDWVIIIKGVRTYQIMVEATSERDARAQAEQLVVTGAVNFSDELVGFDWQIVSVETA